MNWLHSFLLNFAFCVVVCVSEAFLFGEDLVVLSGSLGTMVADVAEERTK
jgi:hypothetical protein